jgi:hypothetical protein
MSARRSGVQVFPQDSRAGSPGMAKKSVKVMTLTSQRMAIEDSTRRIKKRATLVALLG